MGTQTVLGSTLLTPLDLWKERRLSALSNTTCGTFMSSSPNGSNDIDLESVYTHRSSVSSMRTRTRSRSERSLHASWPVLGDHVDERGSILIPMESGEPTITNDETNNANANNQQDAAAAMFTTSSIRVWKQTPRAQWMNVFVPRYVTLQTGAHPYMEYARQANGPIRQRMYLTTTTRLDRLPKNKLVIDFEGRAANTSSSKSKPTQVIEKAHSKRRRDEPTTSANNTPDQQNQWTLRFETKHDRDLWAKKIQDAVDLLVWINKFTIGQVVTTSGSSTLAECFTWLDQDRPSYVLKAITTETKKQSLTARDEIHIHHLLTNFASHPNVLTLQDSFRQQGRAYVVLDYCTGGDLFDFLQHHGPLDDASAKTLFRRIAEAISYVHDNHVVHLDIKPENLLFHTSPMQLESIKLADFGSAQVITDPTGHVSKGSVNCTIGYAAPEVLDRGDVSFAADVFSAGAVLFTMLCGFAPFQSGSDEETMTRSMLGDFSFDHMDHVLSAQAKDLICGMLEVDPRERFSMDEVLSHPWLQ